MDRQTILRLEIPLMFSLFMLWDSLEWMTQKVRSEKIFSPNPQRCQGTRTCAANGARSVCSLAFLLLLAFRTEGMIDDTSKPSTSKSHNISAWRKVSHRPLHKTLIQFKMKFSMLAIAATALAAGVEGFSPARSFAVRKVSFEFRFVGWGLFTADTFGRKTWDGVGRYGAEVLSKMMSLFYLQMSGTTKTTRLELDVYKAGNMTDMILFIRCHGRRNLWYSCMEFSVSNEWINTLATGLQP